MRKYENPQATSENRCAPRSYYIPGGKSEYTLLNGTWRFAFYGRDIDVPEKIENVSVHWASTGVDETELVTLRYPWGLANLAASIGVRLDERTVIMGDQGQLRMLKPHYGSEFVLRRPDGSEETWRDEETENGFVYETLEVMRCVREGLLESPTVPHDLTIRCAKVFDLLNASK